MSALDLSVDAFRVYVTKLYSKNTGEKYAQAASRLLQFLGENGLVLDRLPPGALSMFAEWLLGNGLKPASVKTFSSGAKKYIEWMRDRGKQIPHLSKPILPKVHAPAPNIIQGNALVQYLALSSRIKEPMRTAMLLLPYNGLRTAEEVSLKLSNITRMNIPAQNQRAATDAIVFTVRGKGGKVRTVPLLSDGKTLLIQYLKGWRSTQPGDWLFPMPGGHHVSGRTLRGKIKDISKIVGEERLTLHTLRRTYITTLHRNGLDPVMIAKIAGHESLQTTANNYLVVEAEDIAGKVQNMRLVSHGADAQRVTEASKAFGDFLGKTADARIALPDPATPLPPELLSDDEEEDDTDEEEDEDEDE